MSSDLLELEVGVAEEDPQQRRFRYLLFAMVGSVAHTLICLFYFATGYFRGSLEDFLILFGCIWVVNGLLIYIVRSGLNLRLRDPDLLVPQLFILATGIVYSGYYIELFRLSVMILFFAIMLLGATRLRLGAFLAVGIYASLGYLAVLWQVNVDFPTEVTLSVEALEWFSFTIMVITFAVTGNRITRLQRTLAGKNDELNGAFEQLRAMARQDELTGLNNRRYIMELIEKQRARVEAGDYSFVICYCDLDHFKQINDTFGHAAGDEVLKAFAATVNAEIREVDIAGRLGGEEFIIVFSGNTAQTALIVAERIRHAVEKLDFSDLAPKLKVTVSMGMTTFQSGETISAAMARADDLLYKAKTGGRNRIEI